MKNLPILRQKLLLLIYLCVLINCTSFAQIINNPLIERRDITYCEITKIERTSHNTTVHFKYTAPYQYTNGGWVCADRGFFIRDVNTMKDYKLLNAYNIPICPSKYNFSYKGETLEFRLVFEALPNSTTKINIIEDTKSNDSFNFYGVNISTTSNNYSINQAQESKVENNDNIICPSQESKIEDLDKINYIPQSSKPSFETMLAGIKYIRGANRMEDMQKTSLLPAFKALSEYIESMGFTWIGDVSNYQYKNFCEIASVSIGCKYENEKFSNISMTFSISETGYQWEFSTTKTARAKIDDSFDTKTYYFGQVLRDMYGYMKPTFNSNYTLKLAKKQTCWTEDKYRNFVQSNGCDPIEGIYENTASSNKQAKYRVAVRKINGIYYVIYLSGAINSGDWKEGEIKATLEPTATPLFYKAKWIMANKSENSNYYITFEQGLFNLLDSEGEKTLYIKMFPSATDNFGNSSSETASSGTGWAITSNGYIVTNYHVTEGAKSLKVRGINGDFSKTYKAISIIEDKNNDLAIIKIDDTGFTSLETIPYVLANRTSDVGTSVFVLGYPLRATMGDEVKLTNGIISSKSGFQGDVTSYQISAPVQPGNSGGPLFDQNGNVIGIVNAKHLGAENASYAIKISYLLNLIDLMPTPPKLQTVSSVTGKPLTEQVKILKKFTYIIEVN